MSLFPIIPIKKVFFWEIVEKALLLQTEYSTFASKIKSLKYGHAGNLLQEHQ